MIQHRAEASEDRDALPVLQVGEIPLEVEAQRWLIEGLWGTSSVGFLGGSPKSYKSFLGIDMGVSVATGTPCLGRYAVKEPGSVLIYLAEDSLAAVRERVEGVVGHRGLTLSQVDLHVITTSRLRLDQPRDRKRLKETVGALRPRLLLLDPLVRLHALDENHSTAIAGLLSYIRELQREFDLSVVIVHHTRKSGANGTSNGQALRGSGDLYAFFDSALYLRRVRDDLVLSVEHRAAAAPEPVRLELRASDEETVHLEVLGKAQGERERRERDIERALLEKLAQHENSLTRGELRKVLGVKNQRLGEVLQRLEQDGVLERDPRGWRLSQRGYLQDRSHSPI